MHLIQTPRHPIIHRVAACHQGAGGGGQAGTHWGGAAWPPVYVWYTFGICLVYVRSMVYVWYMVWYVCFLVIVMFGVVLIMQWLLKCNQMMPLGMLVM